MYIKRTVVVSLLLCDIFVDLYEVVETVDFDHSN